MRERILLLRRSLLIDGREKQMSVSFLFTKTCRAGGRTSDAHVSGRENYISSIVISFALTRCAITAQRVYGRSPVRLFNPVFRERIAFIIDRVCASQLRDFALARNVKRRHARRQEHEGSQCIRTCNHDDRKSQPNIKHKRSLIYYNRPSVRLSDHHDLNIFRLTTTSMTFLHA